MENEKKPEQYDLVVIGGGPAGMMCAYTAAQRGVKVVLFDPNRMLGRKLRITGKGRCNVTNNCDIKDVLSNVPVNSKFLYSAINAFSPQNTIDFFEKAGVPLKTERGNRVFPVSDNANDIADAIAGLCLKRGVSLRREKVREILVKDGEICGVRSETGYVLCKNCAVCTGGISYPLTGSTGDGYHFAESLHHSVTPAKPSLVPLESNDPWCGALQGLALKNVRLTLLRDNTEIYSDFGEMLFTHFGISGPIVLSASSHMRELKGSGYRIEIDLKPALDEKKLDSRILRDFAKYSNRELKNSLGDLLASGMIPVVIALSGIDPETKVNSITREQRMKLLQILKKFPISISGFRPVDEAIVTSGGVSVKEINPRTMESKLVKGMYFAGEVLDVDAYTGGFNLQIAWATGYVAGKSVCREKT